MARETFRHNWQDMINGDCCGTCAHHRGGGLDETNLGRPDINSCYCWAPGSPFYTHVVDRAIKGRINPDHSGDPQFCNNWLGGLRFVREVKDVDPSAPGR